MAENRFNFDTSELSWMKRADENPIEEIVSKSHDIKCAMMCAMNLKSLKNKLADNNIYKATLNANMM